MPSNDIEPDRLPRGVKVCVGNATRLLADAKLLRDSKRFHSALVFAIFAYEELGKAIFLKDRWRKNKSIPLKEWNKKMLDHSSKSFVANYYIRMSTGKGFQSDDQEFLKELRKLEHKMLKFDATEWSETEKQTYLYVNWTAKGWIDPCDPYLFEDKKLVKPNIEGLANRRINEASKALELFLLKRKTQEILSMPEASWIDAEKIQYEIMLELLRFDQSIKVETVIKSDRIKKAIIINSGPRFTSEERGRIASRLKQFKILKKTELVFQDV